MGPPLGSWDGGFAHRHQPTLKQKREGGWFTFREDPPCARHQVCKAPNDLVLPSSLLWVSLRRPTQTDSYKVESGLFSYKISKTHSAISAILKIFVTFAGKVVFFFFFYFCVFYFLLWKFSNPHKPSTSHCLCFIHLHSPTPIILFFWSFLR